jgi:hypothetical protein
MTDEECWEEADKLLQDALTTWMLRNDRVLFSEGEKLDLIRTLLYTVIRSKK